MKIYPNQLLYTDGYDRLPNGTQVVVDSNHNGGNIVSCLTGSKAIHFIPEKCLVKVKPVSVVPTYLKPLGATVIASGRCVFVYGHPTIKDGSIHYVSDGYIHNGILEDIRCDCRSTKPTTTEVIGKKYLYIQPITQVNTRVQKPLASTCTSLTEDHKYMIELLKEPNRELLIEKILDGVDLSVYDVVKALKYYVLIPKDPETLYVPMLMAHTDIIRSVKHPTDLNLEYDPLLDKFTSPTGLGADDRAGCYAINRILKNHPGKFIIALFDEEEIGCLGSNAFALTAAFERVNKLASCYISIDRRRGYNGISQIATYDYDNSQLFDLIKTATGRLPVKGSSTDCRVLSARSYNLPAKAGQSRLACFNMSCGYENEHQVSESLYFSELQKVVEDFDAIVDLASELWEEPFEATRPTTTKAKGKTTYTYGNTWLSDEIMVDNTSYDEGDVRALLWYYRQTYGKVFAFTDMNKSCKEFVKDDYVRLDPKCSVGGTFGGTVLSSDLYTTLIKYTWVVTHAVDAKMLCGLVSEDGTATASNIPYAWLKLVLIGDALVESN